MLTDGSKLKNINGANPIQKIINIFVSVINTYSQAYEPYLQNDEKYFLYDNDSCDKINKNKLFNQFLRTVVGNTILFGRVNLRGADLRRTNLSEEDLNGAYL
jgi:uncharacterized protein YjbI with pentapeptide repeats